jgi:hypothetical protein
MAMPLAVAFQGTWRATLAGLGAAKDPKCERQLSVTQIQTCCREVVPQEDIIEPWSRLVKRRLAKAVVAFTLIARPER